ncbi:MAG: NAD-dependent epimerase/dehydratase family protein [Pseudomonadota bacterium]
MRVFILGGTGSIGTGVVRELQNRGHDVTGLSRSVRADEALTSQGINVVRGNIEDPESWMQIASDHDALIHTASTFEDNMGAIDRKLTDVLMDAVSHRAESLRFIYTGGCWQYGETGDHVATEETPFRPIGAFSWFTQVAKKLLSSQKLLTAIVHPAMVYHEDGGVFEDFILAAKDGRPIEIWGSTETRWPIVERSDLARAYCDLLEDQQLCGHYNVTSQEGVYVRDIAQSVSNHFDQDFKYVTVDVDELIKRYGAWAFGPTIDQQMSADKLSKATDWSPRFLDFRKTPLFGFKS